MAEYHEYALSTNEIGKPKVIKDQKAIGVLLYHLIMMNPGDNSIYPEMGVGLTTKWKYISRQELDDLQTCIADQIALYLPELQAVNITLKINSTNKTLSIDISTDEYMYSFDTSKLSTPITISDFTK